MTCNKTEICLSIQSVLINVKFSNLSISKLSRRCEIKAAMKAYEESYARLGQTVRVKISNCTHNVIARHRLDIRSFVKITEQGGIDASVEAF